MLKYKCPNYICPSLKQFSEENIFFWRNIAIKNVCDEKNVITTFVLKNLKLWRKKLKFPLKLRNQIMTKPKNLNCDKAHQLLFLKDY